MKLTTLEILSFAEYIIFMFFGLSILALAIMVIHLRTFGIDAAQLDSASLNAIAAIYMGLVWAAFLLISILQMILLAFLKPHKPNADALEA